MTWLIFAFLTALFESLKDVSSKMNLRNIDEYIISWSLRFFALPFLIPLLFFTKIPSLGTQFWIALLVGGSLNVFTTILYMKAIKASDLSITVPMVTFTPLFLLLTSPFMVGEFPGIYGIIGIVLVVLGSYVLNIKQRHKGYFAPFRALLKEKGPKLMLLVAFIWSITSNFDKIGVKNSSSIFWAIVMNIFLTIAMFPIMLYKSQGSIKQIIVNYKALIPIGLFSALVLVSQMTALNLTLVANVISIKRTSTILSVFLGYFIFKEKGMTERLLGVVIMVAGVLFITLS
ncbi:EamA family transporter [Candidatus Desantisbacteria bacterium]|nr:EamA family transporter [Candidatus Desantisbacteria bacterium]